MTAKEFAMSMIEDSGFQLNACLNGVTDELSTKAPLNSVMPIREMLVHIAEAYRAIIAGAKGEKYEWGSYADPGGSFSDLVVAVNSLRSEAVEVALENLETHPEYAQGYLAAHDYYHVGQLVSLRVNLDREFNPYSIYKHF
jgi:hypothetical protein